MRKILKIIGITIISLIAIPVIAGLILAYLPTKSKTNHAGITPKQAAETRQHYAGPHDQFKTSDGITLFLRRWDPDTTAKKGIAVLIFHGFTAHSGAYNMAGVPISAGGYTTFGLDYRGHGLSDGNRGDAPGVKRWIADFAESVKYLKSLGYSKVIILGHSLGVASAMCAANALPNEVSGLVLLSGAYEGRKGLTPPPGFFEKARIISSSIVRPSYPAVEYYRRGMTVTNDSLFNFRYTLRYMTMLDVKKLRLSGDLEIPILVGAGDQDELFEVGKVHDFYDSIPSSHKEFLVMKNTTHAKIPVESWQEVVNWLNRNF